MSYYDRQFLGLNPRDFGATGDGTTDDTQAFQDCQAEAISSGINAVSFDDGIYVIGTTGLGLMTSGAAWLLGDIGVDGFVFEGSGPGSVLLFSPTPVDTSVAVINLRTTVNPVSKFVVMRNFRIDGNRANISGLAVTATISGIRLDEGEDCRVENVIVHDMFGDEGVGNTRRAAGISLGGNDAARFAKRCVVRDCISYGNVGSGLSALNIAEYGAIENSIAYDNYAADINVLNLSTPTTSRALFLRNCTFATGPNAVSPNLNLAMQLESGSADAAQDIQVDGCSILGRIQVFDTDRAFVDDCIIYDDEDNFLIRLNANADRVVFSDNIIGMTNVSGAGTVFGLEQLGGGAPKLDWALRNNIILPSRVAVGGTGFVGGDAEIEGNTIIYDGASITSSQLNFRSNDADSSVRIRRNVVVGESGCGTFRAAVASSWPSIIIMDNFFGTTRAGFRQPFTYATVGAGTFASRPVYHNNILSSVMNRLINPTHFALFPQDCIIVGGNYDTIDNLLEFALPHCLRNGGINGAVFGRVGDEASNIAGAAGAIHHVKDSGNVTSTGWVAK